MAVLSGTPVHLACLPQCFLPHFFPLSLLPPLSPALLHPLFSLLHTPHRASSHWCPSSWTIPVRAPTSRANFLIQSKIFEAVQDASTSSPCQIFESVQTPPAALAKFSSQSQTPPPARAKFSSQSNTTAANFRVSPRPLRTAPTKIDWQALKSYKQL
jgi:hypothetical protein